MFSRSYYFVQNNKHTNEIPASVFIYPGALLGFHLTKNVHLYQLSSDRSKSKLPLHGGNVLTLYHRNLVITESILVARRVTLLV